MNSKFNKTSLGPAIQNQAGAALVVGMVLLLSMTIVGVTVMNTSVQDERMAGNQKQNTDAFLAAEAGLLSASNALRKYIKDEDMDSSDWVDYLNANYKETDEHGVELEFEHRQWREFTVENEEFSSIDYPIGENILAKYTVVAKKGKSPDGDQLLIKSTGSIGDRTKREIQAILSISALSGDDIFDPAFSAGLLSDNNIRINGASWFQGSIHANGFFDNRGGSVLHDNIKVDENGEDQVVESYISAAGDVNYGGTTPDGEQRTAPNSNEIEVPSAADHINQNKNNAGVIHSCNIPSGDGDGATYYCDGDISLSDDYSNVTVMASGDITQGGSSSLGQAGGLSVALISSGDIRLDGSSDVKGVFWSEGQFLQNGSARIFGSVVSGGKIRYNGSFWYQQISDFSPNISLPEKEQEYAELRLSEWTELIDAQ